VHCALEAVISIPQGAPIVAAAAFVYKEDRMPQRKPARAIANVSAIVATLLSMAALAAENGAQTLAQQSAWVGSAATQAQLDAGKVAVQSDFDASAHVSIDAAIRVHATPQQIWPLITRCDSASIMFPELKHCRQLSSAPDGSWDIVEHDIKLALLLPTVHSVFRNDYHAPYRLDFHRVSGDMKYEEGSYVLQPSTDGHTTTIEYRVALQPGFFVPRGIVKHSLRKRLPAALMALRARAEQLSAQAPLVSSTSSDTAQGPASPQQAPAPPSVQ
jgi:hypothetical protein